MNKERQLRRLKISPDLNEVVIDWVEIRTTDEDVKRPKHRDTGDYRPHKDLVDRMKKLRKHALEMLGISLGEKSKDLPKWATLMIKIDGDLLTKQSRLRITLGIKNDKTGKVSKIETQQMTMYPAMDDASKYHAADEVAKLVEEIQEEAWLYGAGKYEAEDKPNQQLALFHFNEMRVAS